MSGWLNDSDNSNNMDRFLISPPKCMYPMEFTTNAASYLNPYFSLINCVIYITYRCGIIYLERRVGEVGVKNPHRSRDLHIIISEDYGFNMLFINITISRIFIIPSSFISAISSYSFNNTIFIAITTSRILT